MTYRQLAEALKTIPEEHLDDHVTVYDSYEDTFTPCEGFYTVENTSVEGSGPDFVGRGVLDEGHPYLLMKA